MSYKIKAFERAIQKIKKEEIKISERVEKARNDFFYFAKEYLPHIFTKPFAKYQIEIINYLMNNKIKRIAIAAPRQHGKTSLVFIGYVLYSILFKKHNYIVVLSSSEEQAKEQLENIKLELENNEKILEDFEFKEKYFSSNKIVIDDVYIISRGAGSSLRGLLRRGKRPDLIIVDDIEKEIHSESLTMRKKLKNFFYRVVMNLGKDSKIFVIGTILHYDSLLNELIKKGEELGWFVKKYKAITDDGKPLNPYLWSLEDLERKKQEIGSIAFSYEFLNEPLSEEDRLFREEWIVYYEKDELINKKLEIIMGIDPALGSGDYSAIVVVAKDDYQNYYILESIGKKITPDKFIDLILETYLKYKPSIIAIETNVFQKVLKDYLYEKALQRKIVLPIKEVKNTINKESRIAKLSPLIENQKIKFRKEDRLLIEQLLLFPKGAHDDLPDALEMAISVSFNTTKFNFNFIPRRRIV